MKFNYSQEEGYMNSVPKWNTKAGEIIGWMDDGLMRATGIPYAKAQRFQPPQPLPFSSDPIIAKNWSPACPQLPVPYLDQMLGSTPIAHLTTNEHCQHLSITLPADVPPSEKLPVMVWIHGGSYVSGAGDATVYDPSLLVKEQRVIVVNITYRLGLFGFLGRNSICPANLGLLDMIEALRWIKKNIAGFGGDENNITLFGQSAGGDAIAHLMIAEGTEGLFQRAIIQSAPLGISRGRKKMTDAMEMVAVDISEKTPAEEVVEKEDHVALVAKKFGLKSGMPFGTQYGHAPLPREEDLENECLNRASQYEVLIGFANEETSFFLPQMPLLQKLTQMPVIGSLFKRQLIHTTTNMVYGNGAKHFARRHAKGGGKAFLYNIHWGSRTNGFGATHTIDLPLILGKEDTWKKAELVRGIQWSEVFEKGKKIRALWAQFARSGSIPGNGALDPSLIRIKRMEG